MRRLILLLSVIISLPVATALAQGNTQREIYDHAEQEYRIGRIDLALGLLQENLGNFTGRQMVSAYRLIALCHLGNDNMELAEQSIAKMLEHDPYYSPSTQDPARFVDMVRRIRQGRSSTITTASSTAESLSEVPVPTTLITEQMIRNCGGRNLQEVLAAYVPGINFVDCNDDINLSMRSIYSVGQEKILIMLNGHRLNSYATNIASPDFSIGLEKLKQIEVLRGPASSLYGGVALTAVVNLITKEGADIDGVQAGGGIGSYGQYRGNVLLGKHYYDLDILFWGNIYTAKGERKDFKPSGANDDEAWRKVTVGGIGKRPSFEFGTQMKYRGLNFLYSTQFSQIIAPLSVGTTSQPYTYDRYRTYNGMGPSFATRSHHGHLSYSHTLGNVVMRYHMTYDNCDVTHYNVLAEDTIPWMGTFAGLPADLSTVFEYYGGTTRYISGQENTLGWKIQGDYNYINTSEHKGHISFGAEYSYFQLEDVHYTIGYDFVNTVPENYSLIEQGKGHENTYNGFLQLKHQWRSFILNGGLRFDHKQRYNDTRINEFSPRLALIYVRPKWNVKFSYSKSFVDAPYLYQKSNEFLYTMSAPGITQDQLRENVLSPETLHSFQATLAGTNWADGLDMELNAFYNVANDLIETELLMHGNIGQNRICGVEFQGSFLRPKFSANLNMTWMKIIDSDTGFAGDASNSVPSLTSNLVLAWRPTERLRLSSHILFESNKTVYNTSFYALTRIQEINRLIEQYTEEGNAEMVGKLVAESKDILTNKLVSEHHLKPLVTVNLGVSYDLLRNLNMGFNVYNLLNHRYYRSGMSTDLIPQRGRWFMFNVGFKL